ncbi:MAG: DUF1059 domain-containing protein [Actinomycetota bacterium]
MDAGAACSGHFRAGSKEELMRIVADHLVKKHAVKTPTQTIMNFVATLAK